MGNFLRDAYGLDNEQGFMQGAGRILVAPKTQAFPTELSGLLKLASGGTQYDPASGWSDAGFTKTGINITRNNAEEEFTVDQIRASIRRRPTNFEMSVGTQLAESTLETFQLAWELGAIDDDTGTGTIDERTLGLSAPTVFVERRLAVVFQFEDGIIRAYLFRRAVKASQESGFTLQSTGEQVSLPVRWNMLADTEQSVNEQFGVIIEQVPA
jgi:hypothetical protein